MIETIEDFSYENSSAINSKLSGIYMISHPSKPEFYYIGSAMSFYSRWGTHKCDLNRDKHHSKFLSRVCKKYGVEHLVFSVLEIVPNPDNLIAREQHHIDKFDFTKLYNSLPIAGSAKGAIVSQETRNKLSLAGTGRKHSLVSRLKMSLVRKGIGLGVKASEETRKKQSEARRGKKGTPHTPESKAKLSAAKLGKKAAPCSEETKKKLSLAHKGRVFSEEHRASISKAKTGTKLNLSVEQRVALSVRSKGRKATPETIEKIKIAATGRTWSEEMKTKFSELAKGRRSKFTSLTDEQATLVVKKSKEGVKRQDLAEEFGVSYYVIADLLIGKTYKYLNLVESK